MTVGIAVWSAGRRSSGGCRAYTARANGHSAPLSEGGSAPLSRAYALTPPPARRPASRHTEPDRQEPAARARSLTACTTGVLGAPRLLAGRGDEHSPGRDGCRRARALGAGGVERAVRDNGAPEPSSGGAQCPLARTWRAVAAGAECPRHRRDDPDGPRREMTQTSPGRNEPTRSAMTRLRPMCD